MELMAAMQIIRTLREGKIPDTNKTLEEGSVCERQDVREALGIALERLAWSVNEKLREQSMPPNSGKPWTAEEDGRLTAEFEQSLSAREIAIMHGRTRFGIQKRLEHLGKIPPSGDAAPKAA
jgi:hypothetical protein